MRRAIICLVLALVLAPIAFVDVPKALEGIVQIGLFALLVVFVVLMVSHLAEDH